MAADRPGEAPRPGLSVFDTAMVVVSLVVGIGIFRTPALVAGAVHDATPFLVVWGIGGVVAVLGALVFAEIGSRFPRAGGFYKVVAHCFHPLPAFLLNWSQVLMQGAGAAGVAVVGSEYLLRALGRDARGGFAPACVAAGLLGVLFGLNALGVRTGARTQNLLSLSKIVLIFGLAALGLALAPVAEHAFDPAPASVMAGGAASGGAAPGPGLAGWLMGLTAVFYAYGGSQNTMNLAGDVRDARRNLPRAVLLGIGIVTALYLSINAAYVRALGAEAVAASPLVAADLARRVIGSGGETFVSLAIFLSAAGFVNATILHVPRTYVAMAEDRLLPPLLGRLDPRTRAQGPGLLFFAVTTFVPLLFLGSFENLLGYVMFTDALSLALVASCLFVLRRRGEEEAPGSAWRMPGYPALPAAFVLVVLGVAVTILVGQTRVALAGCAVILLGIPFYVVLRRSLAPRPAA